MSPGGARAASPAWGQLGCARPRRGLWGFRVPRLLARAPQDQPLGRAGAQHPPGDGHGGAGPGLRWFRGGSEAGDGRWEQGLGSFLRCCWGCFGPPQGTGAASAPDTQAQPRSPKRRALRPQAPSTVSPRAELDVPKHGWGRVASNRASPSPESPGTEPSIPQPCGPQAPRPQAPNPMAPSLVSPSTKPGARSKSSALKPRVPGHNTGTP